MVKFKVDKCGILQLATPFPRQMTTAQALEWSIKKWEFMVAHLERVKVDGGISTCALCEKFMGFGECGSCPVAKFTGESHCCQTPYEAYRDAQTKQTRFWASKAELAFLRGLRKQVKHG